MLELGVTDKLIRAAGRPGSRAFALFIVAILLACGWSTRPAAAGCGDYLVAHLSTAGGPHAPWVLALTGRHPGGPPVGRHEPSCEQRHPPQSPWHATATWQASDDLVAACLVRPPECPAQGLLNVPFERPVTVIRPALWRPPRHVLS